MGTIAPMPPSSELAGPPRSLALSRERDARVCWLLDTHPVTAAMLVSLGWFPSKNKANKRLRRLVVRNRIRAVGTVCRKAGRPEHVYCRWRPKPDQLLHEVELTELCFRIDAGSIRRGPHVLDHAILPDAELRIGGRTYYLELDRGTMGYAQIARRFRKYEGCPGFVLWVCPTEDRVEALRGRAVRLRHAALFATYAEAMGDPHAEIWRDYGGGRMTLPREVERGNSPR